MITNKSIERYLWISTVMFITYLLVGSFVVSRDLLDLAYLVILYVFILISKIVDRNK